jgi:hypothetical protein
MDYYTSHFFFLMVLGFELGASHWSYISSSRGILTFKSGVEVPNYNHRFVYFSYQVHPFLLILQILYSWAEQWVRLKYIKKNVEHEAPRKAEGGRSSGSRCTGVETGHPFLALCDLERSPCLTELQFLTHGSATRKAMQDPLRSR